MWEALSFQLHRPRQLLDSKANFDTRNNLIGREFEILAHYKYSGFKISSFNSKGCVIQFIFEISGQTI